jgi:hypothetical protein
MAWLHGGVNPAQLALRVRKIVKAQGGWKESWRQEGLLPELPGPISGSSHSAAEFSIKYGKDFGKEPSRFRAVRAKDALKNYTYAANSFVDNLTRSSVYLEKLRTGLPREAALKSTLRAMGDYTRMTTFERRVMRELFPFYAWMRHSTAATLRLPFESPMRMAMIYQLGRISGDPEIRDELGRMAGSRFDLGGGTFFDAGSFSPLADVTDETLTPFDPRQLGRSLTPVLKTIIQQSTGVDPNTLTQSSRPEATYNRGDQGNKRPTPAWSRLITDPGGAIKEMAYQGSRTVPITRGIADALYGNEARYTGTGYPIENLPTNPNMTWNRSLLRALNLPTLWSMDTEETKKRIDKARG